MLGIGTKRLRVERDQQPAAVGAIVILNRQNQLRTRFAGRDPAAGRLGERLGQRAVVRHRHRAVVGRMHDVRCAIRVDGEHPDILNAGRGARQQVELAVQWLHFGRFQTGLRCADHGTADGGHADFRLRNRQIQPQAALLVGQQVAQAGQRQKMRNEQKQQHPQRVCVTARRAGGEGSHQGEAAVRDDGSISIIGPFSGEIV